MDRKVPRTGSEEIELYIRTYYSLLRSSADVQIRTLEEVHANMGSSLHLRARGLDPDLSAFIYSSLRLPPCILQVERVVLGQTAELFRQRGFPDVESWQPVSAAARRRRSFFDGERTMACYIASGTDIDDILPLLTSFQIEWNKLHARLRGEQVRAFLREPVETPEGLDILAAGMGIDRDDLTRLRRVWGASFWSMLEAVSDHEKRLTVRLLAGSLNDYRRGIQQWFDHIEQTFPEIRRRPVYFVSSNPHSLVNLVSGFGLRHEADLVPVLDRPENADLRQEWDEIESRHVPSSRENFLYYVLKKYLQTPAGAALRRQREADEKASGILRIPSEHGPDITAEIVDLSKLRPEWVDPRIRLEGFERLAESDGLILNIDYPLGMGAYLILSHLATRVGDLRGVYVIGKAATLNGVIGDIMIPGVVHDEHSQNTYLFVNGFTAESVADHLVYGTVLDNQKGVSVRGTFLQTPRFMDVFYREGYTDIEMEAGPYLSAVCELYRPKRHPDNEIVNLQGLPFDLGILHYASDTPLSKGRNLGSGSLSYFGMDPTYAAALATLRRIFEIELARLEGPPQRALTATARSRSGA